MKKMLFLLAFLPALLPAQTDWKNLKIIPANPQPGEMVRVEYDWLNGPLAKADAVELTVLEYAEKTPELKEVDLQNLGGKLVGTFVANAKTLAVSIGLQGGERFDNNSGQGYIFPLCDAKGKPLPEGIAAQAVLYAEWGGDMEINSKPDVLLGLLNQAIAAKPDLKKKYFTTYARALSAAKRGEEGKKEVLALLAEMENDPDISEKDLGWIGNTYTRLQEPEKSTGINAKMKAKFPQTAASHEHYRVISLEQDLAKREELIQLFKKDFPPKNDLEKNKIEQAYAQLLGQYGEQQNWEKFTAVAAKVSPDRRASTYNNIAWELGEKGEHLERARLLAAEATEWARMEMVAPSEPKPATETRKNWEQGRRYTYAMYADTYAYVLDKNGDAKAAVKYQGEAVEIHKGGNAEFNERHIGYLERAGSPDLRHQLEGFILKGAATAKMKEQFKKLYVAEDKSDAGANAYLATLEEVARSNMKEELLKKMLDEPSPVFVLKNLQGENVSLDGLRGKVVVVDFWATWCGPCKASFPGMQQAVDKYKADPNVAFVFVDTWENVAEKEKNAADFITSKGYTFNVLMDNDNKVVSSFGVSGIPTKFVVDKSGKIRFKSVGYAGSPDALLDELSLMIEAAKGQP